jgi:adenosylcobinamide-GDP ribazoletransferase
VTALRHALNLFARQFALALQQSTRVRLGGAWAPPAEADAAFLRASDAHLPGTGWIVGLAACLAFAVVALALRGSPWGPAAAAVGSMAVTLLMTGAHAEGALFRGVEHLEPGAAAAGRGTMALVLLLLGKATLLAALASASEGRVMAALFAGHVLSRLAPVVLAQRLAGGMDARTLRVAALWCLPPLLLLWPAGGPAFPALALLVAGLAGYAMARLAAAKRDGELVPASQPVCELGFYLGAAIGA